MRAAVIRGHGGPEVVDYCEVPTPEPGPGEVRLRVRATALNHLDLWVRRGLPGVPPAFPHVGGCDIAGTIDACGPDVADWQVGDPVVVNPQLSCGRCRYCLRGQDNLCLRFAIVGEHTWGGMAEYVVVPARNLERIPEGFSFEEAAACALVFPTAWRMLMTGARIQPGETVLVLGAGGGVNTAAIQIAKLMGCQVWVTASTEEKMRRAYELGADWVLLHRDPDWSQRVWERTGKLGVDVVVDNVGRATWAQALRLLGREGRLVTVGATTGALAETDIRLVFWRQLRIIGSTMANRAEFMDVFRLIWRRQLRAVIDRVLPLEAAREAHALLERGEQFGKIVLRLP
ncbi:MAG: zinc-binding dehydrogenase [Bacteroidetes bacterium]|nr:zinc-binding dehydrogenase [Rhodothermia bacterium]MCS7155155.1 zinc-binding dehydrogenase [Bacteroidota bacterium]MCX7906218.1 zinc-binding dehydrogenase [Bacteroidota bacterium]MDW8138345.1 zinc-binding dehydrogenase [Bacteroidota bacterium]MDW8286030.1 zinc-binding dehydrogenase [Bacteroidota bacterium]